MLWISFGKWSRKAGSLFLYDRCYKDEFKWTPIVYVYPRWTI